MFFLVQIQRNSDGNYTKGVVIHESLDSARQGFHAYLGAYGYGHVESIDYVQCMVIDSDGRVRDSVVDNRIAVLPIPNAEE